MLIQIYYLYIDLYSFNFIVIFIWKHICRLKIPISNLRAKTVKRKKTSERFLQHTTQQNKYWTFFKYEIKVLNNIVFISQSLQNPMKTSSLAETALFV